MMDNLRLSLIVCAVLFGTYIASQSLVLFDLIQPNRFTFLVGYFSILLFFPSFSVFIYRFFTSYNAEKQALECRYDAINRSNLVVIFDCDGTIKSVNDWFCSATGYSREDLVGSHHSKLLKPGVKDNPGYALFWANLKTGDYIKGRFERITREGTSLWLDATYTPVKNHAGRVHQIIKIATDVTANHNNNLELAKKNKYLEHAAKILRHDMHSGINTYMPRGLSSLKRRLPEDAIKEYKLESSLRLLSDGLRHTQRVYDGVKEFTNLVKDNAKMEKQSLDLRDILEEYLRDTAYSDQVLIEWLPTVEVNGPLFCTAIDNFIRNGLKYNDSPSKMVAITMVDDYTLGVIDNGRGMSNSDFKKLSVPYQRKDGQVESGTGLGLSISIAILDEHKFPVEACLNEDVGTTMRIKIL